MRAVPRKRNTSSAEYGRTMPFHRSSFSQLSRRSCASSRSMSCRDTRSSSAAPISATVLMVAVLLDRLIQLLICPQRQELFQLVVCDDFVEQPRGQLVFARGVALLANFFLDVRPLFLRD